MRDSIHLFVLMGLSLLGSACGNQMNRPDPRFSVYQTNASGDSGNYLSPNLKCSETPNIQSATSIAGSSYRACRSDQTTPGSIEIYSTSSSESVCVFAALSGRPVVYNNTLAAQCGTLTASGQSLTFSGIQFDSIYVVSQARANSLVQALMSGNPTAYANQNGFSYAFGTL